MGPPPAAFSSHDLNGLLIQSKTIMQPTSNIQVVVVQQGEPLIVAVRGEGGVHESQRLDQELMRISTLHPALAVLDLSGLQFISSIGMGSLVSFQRSLGRHGGKVRLAACAGMVRDALHRARLDKQFEMYDTVDAATAGAR